jgi:hypothetical protein
MRELRLGLLVVLAAGLMAACGTLQDTAGTGTAAIDYANPAHIEEWDGRGTDSERCDKAGEFGRPESGWIHWVYSTKGATTDARLHLGGSGDGEYEPGEPLAANVWHFYTPFFDLDELEAEIWLYGGDPGRGGGLVISDYCPGDGRTLKVSKTAETSFKRIHDWKVEKSVDPDEVYLYVDGSGDQTVEWTVDVTYLGYTDSHFNISGEITIENIGTSDKVITSVTDDLGIPGYEDIDVDCGVDLEAGHTLEPGETLTCTYSEDFAEKPAESGTNTVTVVEETEGEYTAEADWEFADPTVEWYAEVDVKDLSDLFGWVDLGTVTAPDGDSFTYDKHFAWEDYGADDCDKYVYDNIAKLYAGDNLLDSDTATLKVYVQCLTEETAWAANGDEPLEIPYVDDGGSWATFVEYEADKTTTLFAGRTIPVGTAHFSAPVGGVVTITLMLTTAEFQDVAENLKVQDYATAPDSNPNPGGFDHKETCSIAETVCTIDVPLNDFYGVHLDVLAPDPDFGPETE